MIILQTKNQISLSVLYTNFPIFLSEKLCSMEVANPLDIIFFFEKMLMIS